MIGDLLKSIRKNIKKPCEVRIATNEIGAGLYIQIDWYDGSDYHYRKQLSYYDLLLDITTLVLNVAREADRSYDNQAHATDKDPRNVPTNN